MELKQSQYRAAMHGGRYQAQIRCPGCTNWILTKNLEVYKVFADKKDETPVREAIATDVICEQTGCGEIIGTVKFQLWPYSAPVAWRNPPSEIKGENEPKKKAKSRKAVDITVEKDG